MEPTILGLVLDSSVLISAERRKLTVVLSAVTVAEIGHGIYRALTPEIRERRRAFLDDLKAAVLIYPLLHARPIVYTLVLTQWSLKGRSPESGQY